MSVGPTAPTSGISRRARAEGRMARMRARSGMPDGGHRGGRRESRAVAGSGGASLMRGGEARRAMDATVAWLLDPAEPAVRAQALVDLLDRDPGDPEVAAARGDIPRRGMAARVLADVDLGAADPYRPKYGAP